MFDTICHEHLEYYSSKVILDLCNKNNLRVFNIKTNKINGSSKQYYICHQNSKYKSNQKEIDSIINFEDKLQLSKEKTYKNFISAINNSKNKLCKFLNNNIKLGKKVHGYGASTKGNVLLQYYKINNKMVEFIAERNSNKYNLFTPGTDIKIISEALSRFYKLDYYLVLPWHFEKEILNREKKLEKRAQNLFFLCQNLRLFRVHNFFINPSKWV